MALFGLFAVTIVAMIVVSVKAGTARGLTMLMWLAAWAYGFSGGI